MNMAEPTRSNLISRDAKRSDAAPSGNEPLQSLRAAAAQHRAAARAVIDNALSANSEAFLRANRQQSGQ